METNRVPPHNMEAEMAVLGAMLLNREAAGLAVEKLSADNFYSSMHRKLFTHIVPLYDENKPVDLLTVTERLKNANELESAGGASYIAGILNSVPTAANVEYYINIVRGKYILRRLIDTSSEIAAQCYAFQEDVSGVLDYAEKKIFDITQNRGSGDIVPFKELIKDSIEAVEKICEHKRMVTGVASGFTDFDKISSGFQPSDFIVFAGRPSMGKTSLALNIAEYAALEEEVPVAIFSLEMSRLQIVMRILCSHSRVNIHRVRTGFLRESDFPSLVSAAGRLAAAPIFIDDTPGISIMELRAKARRLKAKHDIRLIIVDYLQLMQAKNRRSESRQQDISDISRAFKGLARELNIPVIVLSQLNRAVESRQEHKPQLSDLRESGAIEQDADMVALLLRRDYYDPLDNPGVTDVIIAKQRNGPTGEIKLKFFSDYTRFENYTEDDVPAAID